MTEDGTFFYTESNGFDITSATPKNLTPQPHSLLRLGGIIPSPTRRGIGVEVFIDSNLPTFYNAFQIDELHRHTVLLS